MEAQSFQESVIAYGSLEARETLRENLPGQLPIENLVGVFYFGRHQRRRNKQFEIRGK
jgi:hypothetical protein